jgi:5-methylcytosine-specific restriction endonuclease McrA
LNYIYALNIKDLNTNESNKLPSRDMQELAGHEYICWNKAILENLNNVFENFQQVQIDRKFYQFNESKTINNSSANSHKKNDQEVTIKINYDISEENKTNFPNNKTELPRIRRCKKCFQEYPLNKNFFGHTTKKNFRHVCRDCIKKRVKQHSEANPQLVSKRLKKRKDLENQSSQIKDYDKQSLKLELMKTQKNRCFYCNKILLSNGMDLDHILPLSRGGANIKKNIVLSCTFCNKEKHNKDLNEYRIWRIQNGYSADF